jgi:hypothetical protein
LQCDSDVSLYELIINGGYILSKVKSKNFIIEKHLINQTKEDQFLVRQIANNVVHLGLIWMHVVAAFNYRPITQCVSAKVSAYFFKWETLMYCYNEIKIQVSISNDTLRKKTQLTKTCA